MVKIYELVLTNKEIENLYGKRQLEQMGHRFRLAKKCPEYYHLYTEEIGEPWISFCTKAGLKLYHAYGLKRWERPAK